MAEPGARAPEPEDVGAVSNEEDNVVVDPDADANQEPAAPKRVVLHVLPFVTGVQRQHGLRHDDFERYRRFCSRRLRRIRRALHFLCGKKHYTKKEITKDIVSDERFLHILLYEAERAWSYFNQLKEEMSEDDHKKFHMIGRLRKAAQYANELRELIGEDGSLCDERTELEVAAYAAWMNALHKRERQSWKSALELFGQAKLIYEQLGGVCGEVLSPMYTKRVEDIDAQIRYCSFMLGGSAADLENLLKMKGSSASDMAMLKEKFARVMQSSESETDTLTTITWRGKSKPVTSPKLQIIVLKIRNKEKTLGQADDFTKEMESFDDLFGDYGDAISAIQEEIQAENKMTNPNESNLANLAFFMDYMTYTRYEQTVRRALRMITNTVTIIKEKSGEGKVDDIVQLYSMILQNLNSMEGIESLDDDVEFGKLLSARTLLYKAMRCVYLAQSHLDSARIKEASALLDRASTHARLAQSELAECIDPLEAREATMLKEFQMIVRRQRCLIQAKYFMNTLEAEGKSAQATESADGKTVREKLASFDFGSQIASGSAKLVNFPPDFEPTPCKPLFFDLASNYIEFPDLSERTKAPATGAVGAVTGMLTSGLNKLGFWG